MKHALAVAPQNVADTAYAAGGAATIAPGSDAGPAA